VALVVVVVMIGVIGTYSLEEMFGGGRVVMVEMVVMAVGVVSVLVVVVVVDVACSLVPFIRVFVAGRRKISLPPLLPLMDSVPSLFKSTKELCIIRTNHTIIAGNKQTLSLVMKFPLVLVVLVVAMFFNRLVVFFFMITGGASVSSALAICDIVLFYTK
jgi:hypothetical protein